MSLLLFAGLREVLGLAIIGGAFACGIAVGGGSGLWKRGRKR